MFEHDTSASDFNVLWGSGYVENWSHYDADYRDSIMALVMATIPTSNPVTVEIGPGGGTFTTALCGISKTVHAFDVIDRNPQLEPLTNLEWHRRENPQFNLAGLPNESVDFVFSFGAFCHFSFEACASYLADIRRVLNPDGVALVMFGNWNRNQRLRGNPFFPYAFQCESGKGGWFYQDTDTVALLASKSGFTFEDVWPNFRDTMAVLRPIKS